MALPRLVSVGSAPEPLTERSDDELMLLAQAGSRQAFGVVVERDLQRLVQLCSRFINDAQLGQELAQDTWVQVWQRRDKYRADGTFRAWLFTVARNHCFNQLRRRTASVARDAAVADLMAPGSGTQIDELLLEERRRRVRDALEQL